MTPAKNSLRGVEAFVIAAVAKNFGGIWTPGENPPDAYLSVGSRVIAVEISTLTQHVTDDRGTRSRFSDEKTANPDANLWTTPALQAGFDKMLNRSAPIYPGYASQCSAECKCCRTHHRRTAQPGSCNRRLLTVSLVSAPEVTRTHE